MKLLNLERLMKRKNGLYCYDLEELPKEMDALDGGFKSENRY